MQTKNMFIAMLVAGSLLLSGALLYNMEANTNEDSNFSFEYSAPTEAGTKVVVSTQVLEDSTIGNIVGEADFGNLMESMYAEATSEGVDGNYFISSNAEDLDAYFGGF